ncbi:hypothetical protein GCM10020001_069610 [Nonomuraea salmonea]
MAAPLEAPTWGSAGADAVGAGRAAESFVPVRDSDASFEEDLDVFAGASACASEDEDDDEERGAPWGSDWACSGVWPSVWPVAPWSVWPGVRDWMRSPDSGTWAERPSSPRGGSVR